MKVLLISATLVVSLRMLDLMYGPAAYVAMDLRRLLRFVHIAAVVRPLCCTLGALQVTVSSSRIGLKLGSLQ